jgi:hypothetical protein
MQLQRLNFEQEKNTFSDLLEHYAVSLGDWFRPARTEWCLECKHDKNARLSKPEACEEESVAKYLSI